MISKRMNYEYYIFSFILISCISWFLEILYSIVFRYKLVNPGALTGPWCPIYGITYCLIIFMIKKDNKKIINVFKIYLIATIIEYLASFISDILFHKTIWDYSEFFLNINGRICLLMSIVFTMLSYIALYFVEPKLNKIYTKNLNIINNVSKVVLFIFILDLITKIISKNLY